MVVVDPDRVASHVRDWTGRWQGHSTAVALPRSTEDVVEIVRGYGEWLAQSDLPKFFVNAEPGAILRGRPLEFCRGWPNQQEVTVKGTHFIQEDSPEEIGQAVAGWLRGIG